MGLVTWGLTLWASHKKLIPKIRGRTLEVNGQVYTYDMLKRASWLRDVLTARDQGGKKRPRSANSSMEDADPVEIDASRSSRISDTQSTSTASQSQPIQALNSPAPVAGPSSGNMPAPPLAPSQHQARKDEGAEEKDRERSSSRNKGSKKKK